MGHDERSNGRMGEICQPGKALVTNVQRYSLHDGGGIRTVVFLKGCPFRCPWCCNPENLSFEPQLAWNERFCIHCSMPEGADGLCDCPRPPEACPTGAKSRYGTWRDLDDLAYEAMRDRPFFEESGGGVTVSGGECLAGRNLEATLGLLERCHSEGVATAIETTLAVPLGQHATRLVAAADLFLVDFKIADGASSQATLGLDVSLRDANVRHLRGLGVDVADRVVARLPVIPGYTDGGDCVRANARRIRELGIRRADVLPFHQLGESKYASLGKDYELQGVSQLSERDVAPVVETLQEAGIEVTIHGE